MKEQIFFGMRAHLLGKEERNGRTDGRTDGQTDGRTDGRIDILMMSTYQKNGDALMLWTHLRRGRTYVDFNDVRTLQNDTECHSGGRGGIGV
jgi:hypothetical protein